MLFLIILICQFLCEECLRNLRKIEPSKICNISAKLVNGNQRLFIRSIKNRQKIISILVTLRQKMGACLTVSLPAMQAHRPAMYAHLDLLQQHTTRPNMNASRKTTSATTQKARKQRERSETRENSNHFELKKKNQKKQFLNSFYSLMCGNLLSSTSGHNNLDVNL